MLTSKDPRDSLFQEGSSRFLFGRGPSACPLVFPLCLVFPPVDRHSRLDLSHYYTRFSYYTRHPFYLEANVERSLRAATLGSRFTPVYRSLRSRLLFANPLSAIQATRSPLIGDTVFLIHATDLSELGGVAPRRLPRAVGSRVLEMKSYRHHGPDLSRPYPLILIFRILPMTRVAAG